MEILALRARGGTVSAIARHVGADRKTIRAFLSGARTRVVRARGKPDAFVPFVEYCRLRLAEDPHLWAVTLHDEVWELGYPGEYSTFTWALRTLRLRPHVSRVPRRRAATTRSSLIRRVRKLGGFQGSSQHPEEGLRRAEIVPGRRRSRRSVSSSRR